MFKDKICVIAPHMKGEYYYEGMERGGYNIITPYRDYNLLMRCMREAWFRLRLPMRRLWYNPKCKSEKAELYVLSDALLTPDFIQFLRKEHPDSRIAIVYQNPVGISLQYQDPSDGATGLAGLKKFGIELWSYDKADCARYGMRYTGNFYQDGWVLNKSVVPDYDIVYVGRDKGRAQRLFETEKTYQEMGLKTYFHICADRRHLHFTRRYYKPLLSYTDYIDLIGKTRGILNIVNEGCDSITLREMEAVFFDIKCITNNPSIKAFEHYHPSRFFVLGDDDSERLREFLQSPFLPVPAEELDKMRVDNFYQEIYLAGK